MEQKRKAFIITVFLFMLTVSISLLLSASPDFYEKEVVIETEMVPKTSAEIQAAWLMGIAGAAALTLFFTGAAYLFAAES